MIIEDQLGHVVETATHPERVQLLVIDGQRKAAAYLDACCVRRLIEDLQVRLGELEGDAMPMRRVR